MNITILQGYAFPIPPYQGGAVEKLWYSLGQKYAAKGHYVVHISRLWEDFPKRETIEGVEHRRIKGYPFQKNFFISKALDALYTISSIRLIPFDADIIVTNTFWAPVFLPVSHKAKIFVSVERMPKGQMKFYTKAAVLRAPSTAVAEAIRQELPKKQHSKIVTIPNPLPYGENGYPNDHAKKPVILYCGRIHPEKGLNLLEPALTAIPDNWSFQIIGPWKETEGGGGENFLQSLKNRFRGKKVEFISPIYDPKRLAEAYSQASIFVYPSIAEKGESFGLAPLEAMAFGCVPVVSNLSCFQDFILHGVNGLIFDHRSVDADQQLSKCITDLIMHEEFRRKLSKQAVEVRKSHSSDRIADEFLMEFEKLLRQDDN